MLLQSRHLSPADLARSEPMRSLLEQATQPTMIEITVVMRPSSSPTMKTAEGAAAAIATKGNEQQQRQLAINARATVGDLKQSIASTFSIPSSEYQISFDDRVLTNDGQRLGDCGIRAGSVVRVQSRGATPTTRPLSVARTQEARDRVEQRLMDQARETRVVLDRETHRHDVGPQSRQ